MFSITLFGAVSYIIKINSCTTGILDIGQNARAPILTPKNACLMGLRNVPGQKSHWARIPVGHETPIRKRHGT